MNVEQKVWEILADSCGLTIEHLGRCDYVSMDDALRAIARALEQPEGREAVAVDAMHAVAVEAWNSHQAACRVTTVSGSLRKVCEAIAATTPPAKVPEGYAQVPERLVRFAASIAGEWMVLFAEASGTDKYERFTYVPAVEEAREEFDALAAAQQPKEGA